ncbi:DUF91 domain-containing protein [Candidatus Woesearchaeota archaeon]|nr:DUF91 domain-containing protein [Candidatus Woesearchaeota archaeon]
MEEYKLEQFLEENPGVIEEGLVVIDRQRKVGAGFVDLLCKDKNDNFVLVEVKLEPSHDSVSQIAKYTLALQKEGIPRGQIMGMLVTQYIDEETQELCDYFNVEAKGLALGKPRKFHQKSIEIKNKETNSESEEQTPQLIQKGGLTVRETAIVKTIIRYNEEKKYPTYAEISSLIRISSSCVRGHVNSILTKGIPVVKNRNFNGKIFLYIDKEKVPNLAIPKQIISDQEDF